MRNNIPRTLAVLLTLVILSGLMPLGALTATAATETLTNGTFETGDASGWVVYQSTTVSADAAYSGNYGAHMQGGGGWGTMLCQSAANIVAGKSYTVSMWIKVLSNGVNVQVCDGTNNQGDILANTWFTTTVWTRLEWTVVPTGNALFLNFCGGGNGVAESVYVDDILIVEVKDPSFDGYLYNGDFETGKSSPWTLYQSSAISTSAAYEGNFGVNLVGNGGWGGLMYQTISGLTAGKTYTISMWYKAISQGVNIQIKADSTSGVDLVSGWYEASKYASWTQIELTFVPTSSVVVLNFCGGGNGNAENVYVDNIVCAKVVEEIDPTEVIGFSGNSIRDSAETEGTGYGLAFRFDITAAGGIKSNRNEYQNNSATVDLGDNSYPVVRMGAVMTNQSSVGGSADALTLDNVDKAKVIDVPAVYLCGLDSESVSFAVRILDIPERHTDTAIYARPYYIYENAEGQQITVYGNTEMATYNGVLNG